jgi:hypothetical protein
MAQITVGHKLTLNGTTYQNYTLGAGDFLPFGFSGVVCNRAGDNVEASLTFPNNALSQSFINTLIKNRTVVSVAEIVDGREIYSYVGQAVSGSVSDDAVSLQLSSVLDAVSTEVPWRFLTEDEVGPLPMNANVRIS